MLVCQLRCCRTSSPTAPRAPRPSAPGAWSLASAWAWARSSAPASWRCPAGRGCSWCMFPSRWRPSAWRRPAWTNRATRNTWLIAGRFLQGHGRRRHAGLPAAVLSHQFADSAARAKAFGAWGVVFGIGLGLGPIIGAGIVALSSWQRVFLVHVPIAVAAFGLAAAGVDESRDPQHRRLDWAGIVSLSVAVFGLAWFITQGVAGQPAPALAGQLARRAAVSSSSPRRNGGPSIRCSISRYSASAASPARCLGRWA